MVIKIEKKLSKTGKVYVGLWFENWLVTIDRRAIYKLVSQELVNNMKVGDFITFEVNGGKAQNFIDVTVDGLPD